MFLFLFECFAFTFLINHLHRRLSSSFKTDYTDSRQLDR